MIAPIIFVDLRKRKAVANICISTHCDCPLIVLLITFCGDPLGAFQQYVYMIFINMLDFSYIEREETTSYKWALSM